MIVKELEANGSFAESEFVDDEEKERRKKAKEAQMDQPKPEHVPDKDGTREPQNPIEKYHLIEVLNREQNGQPKYSD